jgi:NAD(P)-dependent dehydrogenase (short-subunit alcohol dehydrogenase family)
MQSELLNYVPVDGLLRDRVMLVTGAAMGIGKAVALQYARFGATVVLVDKQEHMLDAVYDEIVEAGYPEPVICKLDLLEATADAYASLALMIKQELGRLDGLLLNAAWLGAFMAVRQHDLDLWNKMLQINLNANFLLVRACLPLLEQAPDAAIVFSTDTTDRAYYGAYGVSKAAMNAFCDILAQEYDGQPFIRVNRIHTGPVRTSMRVLNFPGEHADSNVRPEEIVGPYLYFMGPDAGKRTGENLQLGRVPKDFHWVGEQG